MSGLQDLYQAAEDENGEDVEAGAEGAARGELGVNERLGALV